MIAGAFAGAAAVAGWGPFANDGDGARRAPAAPAGSAPGSGRLYGYVRDVNGHPVARARVRARGAPQATRTAATGRFKLPARPGARTVLVEHGDYVRQAVRTRVRRGRRSRVDFSLAVLDAKGARRENSADRLVFWMDCEELAALSAARLKRFIAFGVDGFVCQTRWLRGLGGTHRFTGDRNARLRGRGFRLQRELRRSALTRLVKAGRLTAYLGFYLVNERNRATPLEEWFDEAGWRRAVLPRVRDIASAARSLGFDGVALDQELYPQGERQTASWAWDYPGNGRREGDVRAKVTERGRQLMRTMVEAFPGVDVIAYDTQLPGTWGARVQEEVNDLRDAFSSDVRVDLWNGLSSVQGYAAIRWMDAIFYKTPHLGGDWDAALRYNASQIYSLLSRRFTNWSYASSRLHLSPFSWIDEGNTDFERAREPSQVADQLQAFRRWGMGGRFANFVFARLRRFDYRPYADAMRKASTPGPVDTRPPELSLSSPTGAERYESRQDEVDLAGRAVDNFAIRAVRWYDDRGRAGVAELTWDARSQAGATEARIGWRARGIPTPRGTTRITIVAEDIKGLATARLLTVRR